MAYCNMGKGKETLERPEMAQMFDSCEVVEAVESEGSLGHSGVAFDLVSSISGAVTSP